MLTAFCVIVTAVLVLFVTRLKSVTIVMNDNEKNGGGLPPPRSPEAPPRVEGGRDGRGKLTD